MSFKAVIDRLKALPKEQRQRYIDRTGYTIAFILSCVIVLLMGGERLAPIRDAVGLGWIIQKNDRQKKVFGDCSRAENRSLPECQVREQVRVEGDWKGLRHRESGKAPPFSLSGR